MNDMCESCAYFVPMDDDATWGECHRNSPIPALGNSISPGKRWPNGMSTTHVALWPAVEVGTSCGDFTLSL